MNNKRLKFGYEDTDKIIEVDLYGLVFEIKNLNNLNDLEKLDKNDKNEIERCLEGLLGDGCIEKINKKRVADGHTELDLNVEMTILACIMQAYTSGMNKNFDDRIDTAKKEFNENNMLNREQRRNNNKRRNYNKKNYRRY